VEEGDEGCRELALALKKRGADDGWLGARRKDGIMRGGKKIFSGEEIAS